MNLVASAVRRSWLAYFRGLSAYHRYEVEGLHHLDRGPALIVGYHGRPLAYDLCMLSVACFDRYGYLPHGIVHDVFMHNRFTRAWVDGMGFVTGDGPELASALQRGEHILVAPGGIREAARSGAVQNQVDWGHRVGYLRLALKYRLPVVPVAATGSDAMYLGLFDGNVVTKKFKQIAGFAPPLPIWLGIGPLGIYPLTPPFPVKSRQIVGEPIDLLAEGPVNVKDRAALEHLHARVTAAVQALLDQAAATR